MNTREKIVYPKKALAFPRVIPYNCIMNICGCAGRGTASSVGWIDLS